jgi:hypothetical protein
MASQTSASTEASGDDPSQDEMTAAQSLIYSSSCVIHIFLGKSIRQSEGISTIWVKMTRADLHSVDTFKQALTQYLQHAINLGMTHYYPFLGDVMM